MKRGIQLLLYEGTIIVTINRDGYIRVNMIEDHSGEIVSDDEYISADDFFSDDESKPVVEDDTFVGDSMKSEYTR